MNVAKALVTAMKSEIEGRELYALASQKADDPKATEVFRYLAEEEDAHYNALKSLYGAVLSSADLNAPELPDIHGFEDADSPIFSREFRERLQGRHFEMSALSIAMKLELDSFRFYDSLADQADRPDQTELKTFFRRLADWERTHYDALSKEISFLEQEYFSQNDFAPF